MAELKLDKINKVYDKNVQAVNDFNLHIDDKEFVVFVGPSGCGKSTTLRMIAGLEEITDGDLYIDDKRVNDTPPKNRDIAMVFQNYALYPHMTVYDNIAFGLKLRKFKKADIKEKVDKAAEILGLQDHLDRKPKALSGGQRQRVALGRAIVRDAKVFLMDEPLSNLDAKLRVQMRAEIQKLHQRLQTTTIYVTHDQTEAMTMATRLVVMKDGFIQQVGSPKEVFDHPNNKFVAGFIGSPAMNFFEGELKNGAIQVGETTLQMPHERYQQLVDQGYENKNITFGVRPEDIHDKEEGREVTNITYFETKVTVAELMGSETFLYSTLGEHEFTARVDASSEHIAGDKITLGFDMDKVHFFDQETEEVVK
ncbi:ABC transporter ATP-binding protein [Halalkalibacillus halophilus]|uniref:ABC transporter ATP-binding protein n=1 Tax=Halalkalibacillus halophilus TaxID=392827 RepID=UPI000406B378|nr:sn-glycerol-3-phosphate ABC transporter ATP-binding protein UgpC [Halalkalibacillus halophilus]